MTYLPMIIVPFLGFIVAMIIANEAIVYPAPIRTAFFVFFGFMGFYSTPITIGVFIFYFIKWLYEKYLHICTTDRTEEKIMPTIFAILPLFEYTGQGFFGKFFHYPRSAKQFMELKRLMDLHQVRLKESFPYIEVVSKNDVFVEALRKAGEALIQTHFGMDLNKQFISPNDQKEEKEEQNNNEQNNNEQKEQKTEQKEQKTDK
jgi:hypothetical protein